MSSPDARGERRCLDAGERRAHRPSRGTPVAAREIRGCLRRPEAEIGCIGEVAGLDVVELGCGTAYFSAWLARRGARPSGRPHACAARDRAAADGRDRDRVPALEAPGEAVPLPDASFDLAISEHGAATWPIRAAGCRRRRGCCVPAGGWSSCTGRRSRTSASRRSGRSRRSSTGRTSGWAGRWGRRGRRVPADRTALDRRAARRRLRDRALVELQAPTVARTHEYYADMTAEWARQWPAEEIWAARKAA